MDLLILVLDDSKKRLSAFEKNWGSSRNNTVVTSTTVSNTITNLKKCKWDILFLDHDLGTKETGYDVAKWLNNNPEHKPKTIVCHSMNYAGAKNIQHVLPGTLYHPIVWNYKGEI